MLEVREQIDVRKLEARIQERAAKAPVEEAQKARNAAILFQEALAKLRMVEKLLL